MHTVGGVVPEARTSGVQAGARFLHYDARHYDSRQPEGTVSVQVAIKNLAVFKSV